MKQLIAVVVGFLLLPASVFAATVAAEDAVTVSEASPGNAYLAGTNVRIAAPITGDVAAVGGTILLLAPIHNDALLLGGTVETEGPVTGDLRAVGGRVTVNGPASGDIFVAAGSVKVTGKSGGETRIAALDAQVIGGADGPTIIYGGTVTIGGTFNGTVQIFASDHVTILPGTHVKGILEYDAPAQAELPKDAVVDGGVEYTGSSTFLPTNAEAKTFAIAGAGLFLIVRIIAGMVAAGLAAGLFPQFTNLVADRSVMRSLRRFVLLALLGFACFVATPLLIVLLAISFVGIGVALFVGVGYILLLLLSYVYAGILVGSVITRRFLKKPQTTWRAALLGMLVLHLVGLIPVLGQTAWVILSAVAAGAMVATAYSFVFGRDASEI